MIDLGDLECDWKTTGTATEKVAVGVALTYDEAHAVAYFDLTINNSSDGVIELNMGETIFCKLSSSNGEPLLVFARRPRRPARLPRPQCRFG